MNDRSTQASSAQDEGVRLARRALDLGLMSTASRYDLSMKSERVRSAGDLVDFFFHLVAAIKPDLFIEAGANDARTSRRVARMLPPSRVVAFEANPFTFRRYSSLNSSDSRVEYLNLALSEDDGSAFFNVNLGTDGEPRGDGRGSLMRRHSEDAGLTTVEVGTVALDSFFRGFDYSTSAMWVDVEGACEAVLSGAQETLQKVGVMMIEVEDREYWEGSWPSHQVRNVLLDAGLVPVARDFEYGYQYNLVFVRESLLDHHLVRLRLGQGLSRMGRTGETDTKSGQQSAVLASPLRQLWRRVPIPVRQRINSVRRAVRHRVRPASAEPSR